MTDLLVAPCSYDAAKYAVMHWHYSRLMPKSKLGKFGVWEDGDFIGAVIFGRGARDYGSTYGLDQTECVELVRVALTHHKHPVSQIMSVALSEVKRLNPRLRLIVSFADPEQGHAGGIYKAGNWVYAGMSGYHDEWVIRGRRTHDRAVSLMLKKVPKEPASRMERIRIYIDPDVKKVRSQPKHRYLYPLDRAMRRQIESLRLPYPPAVEGSTVSRDASGVEGQVQPLPTAPTKDRDNG
jgi:hypothetical protein